MLVAHAVPPISSARRRLIASPSPVPPYRRLVEASTWRERLEQLVQAVGRDADAGVADGRGGRPTASGSRRRRAAGRDHDLAGLGELHGVVQQVQQDLADAARVADRRLGRPRLDVVGDLEPLARRDRADQVRRRDSMHARRSNGARSRSIRPASIFEKSRMSLMIESSASPLFAIVAA